MDHAAALLSVDPALVAPWPSAVIAYGPGVDVDEAFDAASSDALSDWGTHPARPTIALFDPAAVTVSDAAALPERAQVIAAQALLDAGEVSPGSVVALPVAAQRAFSTRRTRVVVADVTVELPAPGSPVAVTSGLRDALAAANPDAVPLDGEHLAEVAVRSDRVRYKASAVTSPAPSTSSFVARHPDGTVAGSAPKVADLRRELMAAARDQEAGPFTVSVVKESRRASGDPLLVVSRAAVSRRATVAVNFVAPKPDATVKVTGWVFVALHA